MPQPLAHLASIRRTAHGPSRKGLLRMDMNENVDGLPREAVELIVSRLTPEALASYPETAPFRQALARLLGLPTDNLLVTAGSDGAIACLFDAMVRPGDLVLLTDPSFAMYPVYCDIRQARRSEIAFASGLRFPLEEFLRALEERPRLAVAVSPNNPTGATLTREEFEAISSRCRDLDILLLLDEAYASPLEPGLAALAAKGEHLVVTRTFSKLGGIAGLRLGYAVGPPDVIRAMQALKPSYDVTAPALEAGLTLIERPDILAEIARSIAAGRERLLGFLKGRRIGFVSGDAPFALIHCGSRRDEIKERLAREGILTKSGFNTQGIEDTLRVSLGSAAAMERFLLKFEYIWDSPPSPGQPESEAP
jgi:histidinol-phosphate aminotransferase